MENILFKQNFLKCSLYDICNMCTVYNMYTDFKKKNLKDTQNAQ